MASNPTIVCKVCDASRDCTLHLRAEFPPEAAKAWLRKHCDGPQGAKSCDFAYRAGLQPGGRGCGQ